MIFYKIFSEKICYNILVMGFFFFLSFIFAVNLRSSDGDVKSFMDQEEKISEKNVRLEEAIYLLKIFNCYSVDYSMRTGEEILNDVALDNLKVLFYKEFFYELLMSNEITFHDFDRFVFFVFSE